jgi:hypothetical protein
MFDEPCDIGSSMKELRPIKIMGHARAKDITRVRDGRMKNKK